MTAKVLIRIQALVFLLFYMMAVSGFDVHRCSDDGHVYVEPLFLGISCHDIHPDSSCCHCSHCESDAQEEHHGCEEDETCCSDVIGVLTLSGVDNQYVLSVPAPEMVLVSVVCPPVEEILPFNFQKDGFAYRYSPEDYLSLNCVLRV